VLDEGSALSASIASIAGGRDTQFSEVFLTSDWDGREDCAADRGTKIDDFSEIEPDIDFVLTRVAISEHTIANGQFTNIYYYGDSIGNLYMGIDLDDTNGSLVDFIFQINFPELVNTGTSGGFVLSNPIAGDFTDDQVVISGIAVNPVADLGDFDPQFCGTIGEIVYVSVHDTQGGASNAANQPFRSRIFAIGIFEIGGNPFFIIPVRQLHRSIFSDVAGLAVDDDGSLYFSQVDLVTLNPSTGTGSPGAALFKATELKRTICDTALRVNRSIRDIPTVTSITSGAVVSNASVRRTNYSGGSTVFGNWVAITSGPCNTIYAAVSASNLGTGSLAQGRFAAPPAFPDGLPNMVISFADCGGAFDICSGEAFFQVDPNVGGILPVADGVADAADFGSWRVFVVGLGPDLPGGIGGSAANIPADQHIDFQIDFSGAHAGIAVNEEATVFFISGGAPAADAGLGFSALVTEILCFEDKCPADRRADFVDLRGNAFPNPPASGGNVGDGDSDRFDHIFFQAPNDPISLTPTGLAGLSVGFLRYTNRLGPIEMGPGVTLGVTDQILGDDDFDGPIIFEAFDPGHQAAGGDDQNTPFRGDDDNGAGNPVLVGPLSGGFEFVFGGPVGTPNCVWNGFFWNSNGNITFGDGDPTALGAISAVTFRTGLPKIAPAWADLNPATRVVDGEFGTFPVMAAGFANVNAFKIRWINVPEFGALGGIPDFAACMQMNTFAVTLYDDGTGIDENTNKALSPGNPIGNNAVPFDLQEGPTDNRFETVVSDAAAVGCPPRPQGTGQFVFEYCRMDLIGTKDRPVLAGYSIGLFPGFNEATNPPGICGVNLSCAAEQSDLSPFGVIPASTCVQVGADGTIIPTTTIASICPCLIGEGTEPTIYELFNTGHDASIDPQGLITRAFASFDLRFEGNSPAACTPDRQTDNNRGHVGFYGIGCEPPPNPMCQIVRARPTAFTAGQSDVVDALCDVRLDLFGCGFFPDEDTVICTTGVGTETGPLDPLRAGKDVTTAATLSCDTNGDGVAESVVALIDVTPISKNLIQATIPRVAIGNTSAASTNTAFPLACCGGTGTILVTTTVTSGHNNVFGAFNRTTTCSLALGNRAPVVVSVSGSCNADGTADLIVVGSCFLTPGAVTSVFAIDVETGARVDAQFVIFDNNTLDAFFNFGSANLGHTFEIFVQGPGGTSRNIGMAQQPQGTPQMGCNAIGNEQGIQVRFTCGSTPTPPGGNGGPPDVPTISNCNVKRKPTGAFTLVITGDNIGVGATVTVGGGSARKTLFKNVNAGTQKATKIILKGGVCGLLPGAILIKNPGDSGGTSQPFACNATCATN
jgi:hypothetical protein